MLITSRQRHDEATSRLQPTGPPDISPSFSPSSALCPSAWVAWPHLAPIGPDPTALKRPTRHLINPVGPGTCRGFFTTRGRPAGLAPSRSWRAGVGCSALDLICSRKLVAWWARPLARQQHSSTANITVRRFLFLLILRNNDFLTTGGNVIHMYILFLWITLLCVWFWIRVWLRVQMDWVHPPKNY